MVATISQQLDGLTPSQQRRRLAQMAKQAKGTQRKVYLSEIQALREVRDRLRVHYCSEPRLEMATDARCTPLPGVPCECPDCHQLKREWPTQYLMTVRIHRTDYVGQISYECYEESKAPKDDARYHGRVSTSSSPSAFALQHARMTGARLERGCELEPEGDEALKREIERYSH